MQQTPRATKAVLTYDICRECKKLRAKLREAIGIAVQLESFGQPFYMFPDNVLVARDHHFRIERRDSTATLAVEVMWNSTEGS